MTRRSPAGNGPQEYLRTLHGCPCPGPARRLIGPTVAPRPSLLDRHLGPARRCSPSTPTTSAASGSSTTYSYNLTSGGACLQDGAYCLNAAASAVTAASGGAAMASNYTSPLFHRLYGDGNKTVNALDYARFKA